jgi:hypothetical protein
MIPSGIEPHQPIYRFLNFFDLYRLIRDKELRFTSLYQLDDKNEGLGKILRSLEQSLAFSTNSYCLENSDYPFIKHSTYVSCWTKAPDNIAMWMLYSQDKAGMRIKTSTAKLYAALKTYKNEYQCKTKKIEDFCPDQIDVFEMDYKDLRKAKNEIEKNNTAAIIAMRKSIEGKSKSEACRAWYKTMREHIDNIFDNDATKYKDENYFYEQEVRGQIEFKPTTEDACEYEEYCGYKSFASFLWLNVVEDFVEEICIDPRCPDYKVKIFKEILDPKSELNFVKSEAFGAVLEEKNKFAEPGV